MSRCAVSHLGHSLFSLSGITGEPSEPVFGQNGDLSSEGASLNRRLLSTLSRARVAGTGSLKCVFWLLRKRPCLVPQLGRRFLRRPSGDSYAVPASCSVLSPARRACGGLPGSGSGGDPGGLASCCSMCGADGISFLPRRPQGPGWMTLCPGRAWRS